MKMGLADSIGVCHTVDEEESAGLMAVVRGDGHLRRHRGWQGWVVSEVGRGEGEERMRTYSSIVPYHLQSPMRQRHHAQVQPHPGPLHNEHKEETRAWQLSCSTFNLGLLTYAYAFDGLVYNYIRRPPENHRESYPRRYDVCERYLGSTDETMQPTVLSRLPLANETFLFFFPSILSSPPQYSQSHSCGGPHTRDFSFPSLFYTGMPRVCPSRPHY